MTGPKLGPMEPSHIAEIIEIEKTLFPTPWTQGMFEQEIAVGGNPEGPGSYSVVATTGGRVTGYAVAWFIQDGVHLMNIAVRREYQRRGIGKCLMDHLIEIASATGKRIIVLEVRAGNAAARAFYRKFMFESVGIRRGYYVDSREDAILMALDLGARAAQREREPKKHEPKKRKTD